MLPADGVMMMTIMMVAMMMIAVVMILMTIVMLMMLLMMQTAKVALVGAGLAFGSLQVSRVIR